MSEADLERLEAAQREALPEHRPLGGQRQAGHPPQEGVDGDLALHARERRAETEVDAEAEGDVAIVGAGDVQPVGLRELRGVAVSAWRDATLRRATSESGGSMIASSPRAMSRPHCLKRSRSSTGTPSIWQITVTGSGYANCSIRSIVPAPSTPSSRPSTIACTSGRSRSTIFGVKALLTSPRSRVWSGGSRSSIEKPIAGT